MPSLEYHWNGGVTLLIIELAPSMEEEEYVQDV